MIPDYSLKYYVTGPVSSFFDNLFSTLQASEGLSIIVRSESHTLAQGRQSEHACHSGRRCDLLELR